MHGLTSNGISIEYSEGVIKVSGDTNLLIEIDKKVDEKDYQVLTECLIRMGRYKPDYRSMVLDTFWEAMQCESSGN